MPIVSRCLAVLLSVLLVLPSGDVWALGRHKKTPSAADTSTLAQQQRVLQALNRLTFGPRPGDVAAVESMGLSKWIDEQLYPETIDDSALEARLAAYPAMQLGLRDLVEYFPTQEMIRQAEQGRLAIPADPVEHAIYIDQIADLRARQEKNREQGAGLRAPGAGARNQVAAGSNAASAAGAEMQGNGVPPPPPPDVAPMQGNAASSQPAGAMAAPDAGPPPPPDMDAAHAPNLQQAEEKLYADLGATSVTTLPPEQRIRKLVAMQPQEFRDFLQHLSRPDRVALFRDLTPEQRETVFAMINPQLVVGGELLVTRLLRDIYSERQLQAVMADFWLNHFNVYLRKGAFAPWYLAQYQNQVILPHALGKFEDLLVATAQSPAMLFYLDQTESVGPNSMAARRAAMAPYGHARMLGINENYGRELMELHTLGVNGGYTQQDVIEVAKVFTGWTIERPAQGGGFFFNPNRHEPGSKKVLGHTIREGGEREGLEVLHLLAMSPATAHHVSYEIAQRFVSDNPPPELVNAMAATWMKTGGDIREVLRTMLESPQFWSPEAYRAKVKTPEEYVISAVRATGGDVVHPAALVEAIAQLGMPLYGCQTPNGYAWTSEAWLNSGDLLDRMNFSLALADNNAGTLMRWDALLGISGPDGANPQSKEQGLETLLLDEPASEQTRNAALGQLDQQQNAPVGDQGRPQFARRVNFIRPREFGPLLLAVPPLPPPADQQSALLAGLLLGSPEFQRR